MPDYYDSEEYQLFLEQIVLSGEYIYIKNQGRKCYVIISEDKNEAVGFGRRPKFYNSIINAFSSQTVFLGIYEKELYIYDVLFFEGEDLRNLPILERAKYIKKIVNRINHPDICSAKFYNVNEKFYNYLGLFFKQGNSEIILFNKNNSYAPIKNNILIIDKRAIIVYNSIVKSYCDVEEAFSLPRDEIENWLYWKNPRTGEKLYGYYSKEYAHSEKIIEPISKENYESAQGVIIELPDGRLINMFSNKKINEKVRIGCIEYNNKIIHPFFLEDKNEQD